MTIAAGILVFVPIAGFWAELVTASSMFLTMAVQQSIGNKKGLWLQLPFFMVILFLMYVQLKSGILDAARDPKKNVNNSLTYPLWKSKAAINPSTAKISPNIKML
jgi:hypothetical protein